MSATVHLAEPSIARCCVTLSPNARAQKVANQCTSLGANYIEHKANLLFFTVPADLLPRLQELYGVERLHLCLSSQPQRAEKSQEQSQVVERWLCDSNLPLIAQQWELLHGFQPSCWALTSRRRGSKARGRSSTQPFDDALVDHARACVQRLLPGIAQAHGPDSARSGSARMLVIDLSVSEACACAGVPLMRRRVSSGAYTVHQGMHHAVSFGLGRLVRLQPGDRCLDPCCGTGSILIEMREHWPTSSYLGVDVDESQLALAKANADAALARRPRGGALVLLHASCAAMPLQRASVDAIVSDLPFGVQHGSVEANRALFPRLLKEVGRVLDPSRGRAALLTSQTCAPALLDPDALAAAGLTLHLALPTRHCSIRCVAALLLPAPGGGSPAGGGTPGEAASDRSVSFDLSGCEHMRPDGEAESCRSGEQGRWLSWRQPRLLEPVAGSSATEQR